ncbi:MAG: hypothetical protein JST90_16835 [Bacteroidetes bacterium]|nr:hypothetical protein [Bacteroidota bacterium]
MLTYHPDNPLSAFLHRTGIITDDSRICRFAARVSITTASHSLEEAEVPVSATVDGSRDFGRLGFLEARVNALLYPTDFDAKWQRFRYVDDACLQITGTHPKKMIGRYTVTIKPILNSQAE